MSERDDSYDFIRAVAIVFVAGFHFVACVEEAIGQSLPQVVHIFTTSSCSIGSLGVAWFFILSGCVLQKKYAVEFNPWRFYKKRIIRLFIPLWIAYVFLFFAAYPAYPWMKNVPFHSVLSSLLGMDFYYLYFTGHFDLNLAGEWFTSVIITMYVLFPVLRFLFLRFRKWTTFGILIFFALNQRLEILTIHGKSWSVVNGLTFFWLGMLFETYKGKIVGNRIIPASTLILAGVIFVCFRHGMFGFRYFSTFFFAILLYISAYRFSYLFKPFDSIVQYFSRLNYEIYLVHHRIYFLLIPVFLNKSSSGFDIVCMFITTTAAILLLSEKLSLFSSRLVSRKGAAPSSDNSLRAPKQTLPL